MPNHVHLLIYPTVDNYDIAAITQSIKQSSSRRAIDMARKSNADALSIFQTNTKSRPFQFWQAGGGYDRNIVYRPVLLKSIDYIHNNPIRAGLVSSPEQWKWSSYSDWANVEAGPLEIDVTGIPPT